MKWIRRIFGAKFPKFTNSVVSSRFAFFRLVFVWVVRWSSRNPQECFIQTIFFLIICSIFRPWILSSSLFSFYFPLVFGLLRCPFPGGKLSEENGTVSWLGSGWILRFFRRIGWLETSRVPHENPSVKISGNSSFLFPVERPARFHPLPQT